MSTPLYLTAETAPYTPPTIRGAWDDSASVVTKALDEIMGVTASATVAVAETTTTNNWDVLLYRGVSGKLGAQTISGTIDVMIAVGEGSTLMNAFYHVHIYVTQGDTDTPRGTLLTNYIDATEWAFSNGVGQAFASAQTLSSLAVNDGDRIVIEIGYQAQNTSATSFTGRLTYGQTNGPDMKAGVALAEGNAFVTFSANLVWSSTALEMRVSQEKTSVAYVHSAPRVNMSQMKISVVRNYTGPAARKATFSASFTIGGVDWGG